MNTTKEQIIKQISELDQQYILVWSKMQDYARGTKKHKQIAEQFSKISAELIKLKKSIA